MTKRIFFLGAYTARTKAYVQAMQHYNIKPFMTLMFGSENLNLPGQLTHTVNFSGLNIEFIPNMGIPFSDLLKNCAWEVETITANNINDPQILEKINEYKPDLIIYSGYGSQIVRKPLLNSGIPFLHIHSGWLPDYRGSTTIYYSILNESSCGVSAILLNEKIDQGKIVGRKKYPHPSKDLNIDYLYDSILRADLLVSVLKTYQTHGVFEITEQNQETLEYYVIHPVLKHLSILSLK